MQWMELDATCSQFVETDGAIASVADGNLQISNDNVSSAASDLLREAIMDGRLPPGTRLKENELAERFGISRTPVREALLILKAEGLLIGSPKRGVSVAPFDLAGLDEAYQLRAMIEGYACRVACPRLTEMALTRLQESCERYRNIRGAGALAELVQENLDFHGIIVDSTGSERLKRLVMNLFAVPLSHKALIWFSDEQQAKSLHFHERITSALIAQDPERAAAEMSDHVRDAGQFLVARLKEHDEFDVRLPDVDWNADVDRNGAVPRVP